MRIRPKLRLPIRGAMIRVDLMLLRSAFARRRNSRGVTSLWVFGNRSNVVPVCFIFRSLVRKI